MPYNFELDQRHIDGHVYLDIETPKLRFSLCFQKGGLVNLLVTGDGPTLVGVCPDEYEGDTTMFKGDEVVMTFKSNNKKRSK